MTNGLMGHFVIIMIYKIKTEAFYNGSYEKVFCPDRYQRYTQRGLCCYVLTLESFLLVT